MQALAAATAALTTKNAIQSVASGMKTDGPCLVEAQFFDVVDPAIPPGWEFLSFNDHFRVQPIEFSLNFWDELHDGNESSEAMFNEVLMKLKDFHQMS